MASPANRQSAALGAMGPTEQAGFRSTADDDAMTAYLAAQPETLSIQSRC